VEARPGLPARDATRKAAGGTARRAHEDVRRRIYLRPEPAAQKLSMGNLGQPHAGMGQRKLRRHTGPAAHPCGDGRRAPHQRSSGPRSSGPAVQRLAFQLERRNGWMGHGARRPPRPPAGAPAETQPHRAWRSSWNVEMARWVTGTDAGEPGHNPPARPDPFQLERPDGWMGHRHRHSRDSPCPPSLKCPIRPTFAAEQGRPPSAAAATLWGMFPRRCGRAQRYLHTLTFRHII